MQPLSDSQAIDNIANNLGDEETQEIQENDKFIEIMQGLKRSYLCAFPDCGKVFRYKSEIERHNFIHQDGRPHKCPHEECKKTFKRADALKNHIKTHEGVLPYLCSVPGCSQRFATKAAIRYHRLRHEDKRIYKCQFPGCSKAFLTPSHLAQHQNAPKVHFRLSLCKVETGEEVFQDIELKDEELTTPAPKLTEYTSWEMNRQSHENEAQQEQGQEEEEEDVSDRFKVVLALLLTENRILKEQMREQQYIINSHGNELINNFQSNFQAQE